MATPIYARDLAKENQNDTFMGRGFEKAMQKAAKEGKDIIVGHFLKNWEVA